MSENSKKTAAEVEAPERKPAIVEMAEQAQREAKVPKAQPAPLSYTPTEREAKCVEIGKLIAILAEKEQARAALTEQITTLYHRRDALIIELSKGS